MVIFAYLDADAKGDEGWRAQQDQSGHKGGILEEVGHGDQQKGTKKVDTQDDGCVFDTLFQSAEVELEHEGLLSHICDFKSYFSDIFCEPTATMQRSKT